MSLPRVLTYAEIQVGDSAGFSELITEKMIADFATLSGDTNPLHVDPDYAATTSYGRPIAHGMIIGALMSRLVGMFLPGQYAVYLSQKLIFREPVYAGDKVTLESKVTQKIDAFQTIELAMIAKVGDNIVASGEALVKVLE